MIRTLVRTYAGGDADRFAEIVDRARYCQLLAARSRLSIVQARRLSLAAWLTALENRDDIVRRFAEKHGLAEVLSPSDSAGSARCAEAEILDLVKIFQALRKNHPRLGTDLRPVQKQLEATWAKDPERILMVRRLVGIVRDEAFLAGFAPAAGRILVVDPEESVTPVIAPPLGGEGYDVVVVPSGHEAERMLAHGPVDVIISEFKLPFGDGADFCRRVKADPKTAGIPCLIVTTNKSKATARECLRAGVDDVLTKPVDLETLCLKLRRLTAKAGGVEAGVSAGSVAGSLSEMNFSDMIQIVTAGGKSVAITLTSGGKTGEVAVKDGEIVHAKSGDTVGESAFYEFMRWQDGNFRMQRCESFPVRTIETQVMSLLMEGARLADEGGSGGAGDGCGPQQNPVR